MDKKELGNWGEEKASLFLRKNGYCIIDRNFSCRFGEIDIIARKGSVIAFVEVKLRKNSDFAAAREFVTFSKQRRIINTASLWLLKNNTELQPRFDVIEIYAPDGSMSIKPEITHITDAFQ